MNTGQLAWYVARSAGIVGWGLAAASVVWGLGISLRVARRRPWPAWLLDLHRFLGGAAVIFVAIHIIGVVADSYTTIGPAEVLVPFTGSWHPVALGWGVIAFYLLLAVELTSLARRNIPARLWRRVHYGGFVVFASSTVHALTAGSDTGTSSTLFVVMVAVTTLVAAMTALRVARSLARDPAGPPSQVVDRAATRSLSGAPTSGPSRPLVPSRPDVGEG